MVPSRSKLIIYLALIAVIIYNSWPLGYLLNPVTARNGLASDLEAIGQPFNWLFIIGDVLSCLLILAAAVLLLVEAGKITGKLLSTQAALAIFGVTTALSALIPLNCFRGISACGLTPDQIYSMHNLFSAVGFFALFAGMLITILMTRHLISFTRWDITALTIWSLWGLLFLFVSVYGAETLSYIAHLSLIIVICQEIFLVLSGIIVFLMFYSLVYSFRTDQKITLD